MRPGALIHACEDPADASARRDKARAAAQAKARPLKPVNDAFLEDDGRGHMVPKSPGRVVPVHPLGHDRRVPDGRNGRGGQGGDEGNVG